MSPADVGESTQCYYCHFGLIVTGRCESAHLPKLFRSLAATGLCHFEVVRRVGQRSPITSEKRKLKMVGTGRTIPDKDETEIGLPARRYLSRSPCHFLIVVDDLEYDRRPTAREVFRRYRNILDVMIVPEQQKRAAVHFLVHMLEAYYFAQPLVLNEVLKPSSPFNEYEGDVEEHRHPKQELQRRCERFREIEDGGRILEHLDLEQILRRSETCAWLRTMCAWCVTVLQRVPIPPERPLSEKYCLNDGIYSIITGPQLNALLE